MKKLISIVSIVLLLACLLSSCIGPMTQEQLFDGKTPKALYGESANRFKNHKNENHPYSISFSVTKNDAADESLSLELSYDGEGIKYVYTESSAEASFTEEIIYHGEKMYFKDKNGDKHSYDTKRDYVDKYINEGTRIKDLIPAFPENIPDSWFDNIEFIPSEDGEYYTVTAEPKKQNKNHPLYAEFYESDVICKVSFTKDGVLDKIELENVTINNELCKIVIKLSWALDERISAPGDKDDFADKGEFDPDKGHKPGDDNRLQQPEPDNPIGDYSEGLEYTLSDDGEYYIVSGFGECRDTRIIVPPIHNNLPVKEIAENAFYNPGIFTPIDVRLESITIPSSIVKIGDYALHTSFITNITVEEGNSNYKSIDGNLYSKNGTILIQYAIGKPNSSFTIPNSVTFIGDNAFYGCNYLASITIPNSVTSIGENAFTNCSLGEIHITDLNKWFEISFDGKIETPFNLYVNGELLTELIVPKNITDIGKHTFFACKSLTNIIVDESNAKYKSIDGNLYSKDGTTLIQYAIGKNDASFTVPSNVTSIGDYAFYWCRNLTNITIPSSVTYIGDGAFCDCTSLTSIIIPETVTSIGDYAFYSCLNLANITIPNSLTSIGGYTFCGCSSLTTITIPNGVTSVGDGAFSDCYYLTCITLPNSVTSIGDYAFYSCRNLANITIPNSLTSIGGYTFCGCSSLTTITIPNGVTSVGDGAFSNCYYLTCITLPNSVTSIGNCAFDGCPLTSITVDENNAVYKSIDGNLYSKDSTILIQYAVGKKDSSFVIPDSVTSIGDYAFNGCGYLTSITFPASVTSVGEEAFNGCINIENVYITDLAKWLNISFTVNESGHFISGDEFYTPLCYDLYLNSELLTELIIPGNVNSIGNNAFRGIKSLTSVTIPDSVTYIGERAFEGCKNLTSVNIPDGVTEIGDFAFWGCTGLEHVLIGRGVAKIGESAFNTTFVRYENKVLTTSSIKDITVDENNTKYKSIDGNLYSKDGTTLIQYAAGKKETSFAIPDDVTKIGNGAFWGCENLKSIIIPDSVTEIGSHAFYNCSSLMNITIPDGVTSIESHTFYQCTSLMSITIPKKLPK